MIEQIITIVIVAIISAGAAALAVFFTVRKLSNPTGRDTAAQEEYVNSLKEQINQAKGQTETLNSELTELRNDHNTVTTGKAISDSELGSVRKRYDELEGAFQELKIQLEQSKEAANIVRQQLSEAMSKLAASEQLVDNLKQTKAEAVTQFENLANKILEEKTGKFEEQSRKELGQILQPMRDQMENFRKKIDDSFSSQNRDTHSLKEQIAAIVLAKDELLGSTAQLTQALRGDSKVQGDWGEFVLSDLLRDAGMSEGQQFTVQSHTVDFADPDTGKNRRPDIVINLPDKKHIIIDSKVSLTSYERYVTQSQKEASTLYNHGDDVAETSAAHIPTAEDHLADFLKSVRKHISDLSKVAYPQAVTDRQEAIVVDFTIMFMPIEPAWILLMQNAPGLMKEAWQKNIAIVSPTTLYSTLRAIAHSWRVENYHSNAREIAQQGGKLYDKLAGYVDSMEQVGKSIKSADKHYEEAMGKLYTGRGNLIGQAEKLKQLGISPKKSLPQEFVENAKQYEQLSPYESPE